MKALLFVLLCTGSMQCMQDDSSGNSSGDPAKEIRMLLELKELHGLIQSDFQNRAMHVGNFIQKLETFSYFYPDKHESYMARSEVPDECRTVIKPLIAYYRKIHEFVHKCFSAGCSNCSVNTQERYLAIIADHFPHLSAKDKSKK